MKQYTTPTISLRVKNQAELLHNAELVLLTIKGAGFDEMNFIDIVPTIEDDILSVKLTQEQTARLAGKVYIEATIKMADGTVMKTETKSTYISESVKKGEV